MRTINQTIGDSRDLMTIVQIDMESSYFRFNDLVDDLVLDSTHFDGKVILKNSLSAFKKDINCQDGGTIGQVGSGSFSISRYNSYTGLSNFHEDIYPSTGKPNLTSKKVSIGIAWVGATTLAEITWIWKGSIWFWKYNDSWIDIDCWEILEIEGKILPPYKIQDSDSTNIISYYPNAIESVKGKPIPILYGDFAQNTDIALETYRLAPAIQTGSGYNFKVTCHKCNAINAYDVVYEYLDPIETVQMIESASAASTDTRNGYELNISLNRNPVIGSLWVIPRTWVEGGTDMENALDKSSTTYGTLAAGATAKFKLDSGLSEVQLGQLDGTDTKCVFVVWRGSSAAIDAQLRQFHQDFTATALAGYNNVYNDMDAGTGDKTEIVNFGEGNTNWATVPAKWDDTKAWTAKELDYVEFHIINQAGSNELKIYRCALFLVSTKGARPSRKPSETIRGWGERGGGTKPTPLPVIELIDESKIYCYAKGLSFEAWVE